MIHKPWAINHISFMIHKWSKSWILRMFTYKSHRMTLVEPGPVVTEFEKKVFEEAEKMDLSETDEESETARIFRQIYLRYSHKVFNSIGQTPEEVAEVSVWMSCFFYSLRLPVQLSDRKIGLFFFLQQTLQLIVSKNPPFRHQTNRLYMPLTAMKQADPTGRLPIDAFYKMIFQHDRLFNVSLSILRILHRRMGQGAA